MQIPLWEGYTVLRDDGVVPFITKSLQYGSRFMDRSVRDYVIRTALDDGYTLPIEVRRDPDYMATRRKGREIFNFLHGQTSIDFLSNIRVCDIGCGDGRVARELISEYPELKYAGFDINQNRINELDSNYNDTPYEFHHADIKSEMYNENGRYSASEFSFPFRENYFDLIFANSLFTHLTPVEVTNYLSEIARMVKPSGTAWTSWFLTADERDMTHFDNKFVFDHEYTENGTLFYTRSKRKMTTCYPEECISSIIDSTGLTREETIYGYWRDKEGYKHKHYQDVMLFNNREGNK